MPSSKSVSPYSDRVHAHVVRVLRGAWFRRAAKMTHLSQRPGQPRPKVQPFLFHCFFRLCFACRACSYTLNPRKSARAQKGNYLFVFILFCGLRPLPGWAPPGPAPALACVRGFEGGGVVVGGPLRRADRAGRAGRARREAGESFMNQSRAPPPDRPPTPRPPPAWPTGRALPCIEYAVSPGRPRRRGVLGGRPAPPHSVSEIYAIIGGLPRRVAEAASVCKRLQSVGKAARAWTW